LVSFYHKAVGATLCCVSTFNFHSTKECCSNKLLIGLINYKAKVINLLWFLCRFT